MFIERVIAVTDDLLAAFARLMPQLTPNWPPPSRDLLERLVASECALLLAARWPDAGGPIVGVGALAIVLAPSGAHARIEDVVVDSTLRGKGIGEALTRALLEQARQAGVKYVALTSNPRREAANALYQKVGFKRWETNVYRYDF